MDLLTFNTAQGPRLGVRTAAGVVDVAGARAALGAARAGTGIPDRMEAVIAGGEAARERLAAFVQAAGADAAAPWMLEEAALHLGPCIPRPGKIICIGLNYRQHAAEAGMAIPAVPVVFSKFGNTLAGPGERIPLPATAAEYDYEAELAIVIGRRARDVDERAALRYVLGYCNANDLSARDLQMRTGQWLLGKTLDKFLPIGPYLVTAESLVEPQDLRVRCWVNGELRQDATTADMIFTVAELVSYLSQYMTLDPGDIICTGTPAGVVLGMAEKRWLTPGDEVAVAIERLGRLTNVMTGGRASV